MSHLFTEHERVCGRIGTSIFVAPGSRARAARSRTTATLVQYRVPVVISLILAIFVVYEEGVFKLGECEAPLRVGKDSPPPQKKRQL